MNWNNIHPSAPSRFGWRDEVAPPPFDDTPKEETMAKNEGFGPDYDTRYEEAAACEQSPPAIFKIEAEKFDREWEITVVFMNGRRLRTRWPKLMDALKYANDIGSVNGEN
jgi:hypothetical protein